MKQQQFEQSANSPAIREAILQSARECVFQADALKLFRSLSPVGQEELIEHMDMLVEHMDMLVVGQKNQGH